MQVKSRLVDQQICGDFKGVYASKSNESLMAIEILGIWKKI